MAPTAEAENAATYGPSLASGAAAGPRLRAAHHSVFTSLTNS